MQEETKKREAAEVYDFNKQLTEDIINHNNSTTSVVTKAAGGTSKEEATNLV